MTTLTGGDVHMRDAQIANVAMAVIVQALHQGDDRPLVVVADRGKPAGIARQQHQRRLPRFQHLFFNAGKSKQHHAVNVAPLKHAEMLLHQRRRKLALHHDRVITLLIKGGQHGLNGEVF